MLQAGSTKGRGLSGFQNKSLARTKALDIRFIVGVPVRRLFLLGLQVLGSLWYSDSLTEIYHDLSLVKHGLSLAVTKQVSCNTLFYNDNRNNLNGGMCRIFGIRVAGLKYQEAGSLRLVFRLARELG